MRLIVTRPLVDAERQAEMLRALGHEPLIQPLLEITFPPVTPLRLKGVQALVATSRNALRGLARNDSFELARRLPVYCIARHTADFARKSGFTHVISGTGTAKDMVPLITHAADPEAGALLYLTGRHLAFDLETPLKSAGFAVPRVIIYETHDIGKANAAEFAQTIRSGVDGIVLMSPRTAEAFINLIKNFKLRQEARKITCYCYSEAIAEPLGEIEGLTIAVSSHPTEDEMMRLIGPASLGSAALPDLGDTLGKR
jgi:uroporphyrinogen-III synthase